MAAPTFATEIIAHRGASHDAPENTLASLRLAFAQGAEAAEVDVRLTRDGQIVAFHDPDLRRIAGVRGKIARCTLLEIRRHDAGRWGHWKGRGFSERIPMLEEALALTAPDRRLFIEIKCGAEILPELGRVLELAGEAGARAVIIGFNLEVMRAAKALFGRIEVNWLRASPGRIKRAARLGQIIDKARDAKLDGLDLSSRFRVNQELVRRVRQAGLKLYTWTVDDPRVARHQAQAGVDGITTNRPGWLRAQLGGEPGH